MEGKLLDVAGALQAGLIDEITMGEDLLSSAEKKIRTYMQLNPAVWSTSKLNLRKELIAQLNSDQTAMLDSMLKQWWAPETRMGLQMMIEKLKAKSAQNQ